MRRANGSATAGIVCLARGLAGVDPYADALLARMGGFAWARPLMWVRALPDRARSILSGGLVGTIGGRTQVFDAHVMAALAAGATQLVLLGAGFDARPWRLAEALGDRPVFLLDHPASLAARAHVTATLPARADRRVAIDFARDALGPTLQGAGFDPQQPAVVVWEGVSMYLPEAAVRQTLAQLGTLMAPGSHLSFDIWCPNRGLAAVIESVGRVGLDWMGEPLDFSCATDALPDLLAPAGLDLTSLVSAVEAARAFGGAGLRGLHYVGCARS